MWNLNCHLGPTIGGVSDPKDESASAHEDIKEKTQDQSRDLSVPGNIHGKYSFFIHHASNSKYSVMLYNFCSTIKYIGSEGKVHLSDWSNNLIKDIIIMKILNG